MASDARNHIMISVGSAMYLPKTPEVLINRVANNKLEMFLRLEFCKTYIFCKMLKAVFTESIFIKVISKRNPFLVSFFLYTTYWFCKPLFL